MNRLQRKHFTRHGMHLHTRGKWQLARLVVEALGGLSVSPAAARKAEVVPDTLIAVPPMLPPPPPPSSLPPSLPPPPPPPPSLSPSLPPPPPPPPSPPPSDSIQLTPGPPMPTISCDDAVKEDERNGPCCPFCSFKFTRAKN
ncbi:proline-rich receptor-like protein kinase PERK2 [Homalodisca vitripennis]|uniref:proline-rich receptor-like protein kinase PERK2 n=1 Tax=Homalodisca vitripennis TaxID=197043 RepID=UPI001EEAAD9E|nr:proline-rich receptor-like protein kinase PERK2 [Homalodisca vitripennis]